MAATGTAIQSASETTAGTRADKLRLLVISSDKYPPRFVDVSVLFGEELAGRGHTIDWLMQSEAACSTSYTRAWGGGTMFVGPTDLGTSLPRRIRKHFLSIAHDLKLFRLLRTSGYDVVGVKDKFLSGVLALLAARLFGKRFIYWLSYPFPEEYLYQVKSGTARYPFLYRVRGTTSKLLLYRLLMRSADHVFVQSEQMQRDIAAEGVPLSKMTAVPMGVKLEAQTYGPQRDEPRVISPDTPSFMYVGTLTRVRRLDFLVRVLAAVRRELPDTKLYLVGRGENAEDERVLVAEAARLGVSDGLELVGFQPHAEAMRYVRQADVCVSPFYPTPVLNSASPTKLVEYLAMGKAVVANDHPEQRLVLEQSGGGLCVAWDEEAFAGAVLELLRAPGTRAHMGQLGRRYVEEHREYGKIADIVERQLARVVARGAATAR